MKLLISSLFLCGCTLAGCNNSTHSGHESSRTSPEKLHQHGGTPTHTSPSSAYTTEMSVYNLRSHWATQEGDSIGLEALKGKVQIVAMIYTGCDYACPRIIADLKRIEQSLSGYKKENIGMVLVTLDPERDTPEKLQDFAQKNKLQSDRWVFLTGKESNILELAALLNVKYRQELSMEIAHSNIISVLNQEGELIHQQEGLGVDPDETVKAITSLLKRI